MGAYAMDWMAMAAVSERPARRPMVDFAAVPVSQWRMHDRLENWARWCRGASGESARLGESTPMFRLFRSGEARRAYGEEISVPVDKGDALLIAKGVAALPEKHRRALQWHYLDGRNPTRAAKSLAVTHERLAELVRDARTMLMNRGV